MAIANFATKTVVTVNPRTKVNEAAQLMKERGVGCLVVVEGQRPIGILTDRDLAMEVVAEDVQGSTLAVEDLMGRHVLTVRENTGVHEAILMMKEHGVKRLPVVDSQGLLVGIVAADDLVRWLAIEMADVAMISGRQIRQGPQSASERYL